MSDEGNPVSNIENMLLWVTALEDENLPQASGGLRNGDGYCCLGAACEVAMRHGVQLDVTPPPVDADDDHHGGFYRYDAEVATLPEAVETWLGIDSSNPMIGSRRDLGLPCPRARLDGACGCDDAGEHEDDGPIVQAHCDDDLEAAAANDGEKWTFPVIAKAIRKYYGLPEKENK